MSEQQIASAPADGEKGRRWVFTINNPRIPYPRGLARGMRYLVYQLEKGKEGTPHLQGYCEFERDKRLSGVVSCFEGDYRESQPRGHWEIARGSVEQCKRYCTKLETREDGAWEFGQAGRGTGARTDLSRAAACLLRTGKITDVPNEVFVKYSSGFLKLSARVAGPYRPDLCVVCISGPTGIGKSYAVRDRYPNVYVPYYGNCGIWWDGYCEQEVVCFEEFAGQVQLQKMLQYLDPYTTQVECKGGSVAARWRLVFILSNRRPDLWYDNPIRADGSGSRDGELKALYRRIGYGTENDGHGFYIGENTRDELNAAIDKIGERLCIKPCKGGLSRATGSDKVSAGAAASQQAEEEEVQEVAASSGGHAGHAPSVHACGELGDGCGRSATASTTDGWSSCSDDECGCDKEAASQHLAGCSGLEETSEGEYLVCHHPAHEFCFGGPI